MSVYKYKNETFDFNPFFSVAICLVNHDEVIRALQVLDNLPAYYREFPPREITELKNLIKSKILTVYDIQNNTWDSPNDSSYKADGVFENQVNGTTRGIILKEKIEEYNKNNIIPHIIDLGPGPYHYAIGLMKLKLKFSYESLNINKKAENEARVILTNEIFREPTLDQPTIFLACEIIEHLFNEEDIRYSFDKKAIKKLPEHIIITTPAYDYGQGKSNWLKEGLSHLRAYTPNEFMRKVVEMFPEYNFAIHTEWIVNMVGTLKPDVKDSKTRLE
jgi:hypothetical protein